MRLETPNAVTALDDIDEQVARRIVADGYDRYLKAARERVVPFVDEHFSFSGTGVLHCKAVGWDFLRAPANLILAIPNFGLMCGSRLAKLPDGNVVRIGWETDSSSS